MNVHLFSVFVLLSLFSCCNCWIWGVNWLWKSTASKNENRVIEYIGDVPVPNVPYEAKTDDEKFLEAAKKYTDLQLSELDTCQHKIVLKIRTSCSEMTEEELAKMSVNLLNCQAAVEGREQFPCTDEMSLKECTSAMDADMWNAYHLISNRARAVCYSARQQQFRAQSDIAVNKLMQTAYSQLSTMEKLKEGQQKLGSFAAETLQSLATGQESLLLQQERMKITQQNLRDFVGLNLRELTREKALIAAGHKELSRLTEDIKAKLDAASAQLMDQSSEQKSNHLQLVQDLEVIKEQAKYIWNEIELSTQKILNHHELASLKYEETLDKLTKINTTVNFLLNLLETIHSELNERLGWLSGLIGAAGIYTVFMHIVYLLLGMIAIAYVHAPAFTRMCLLIIVPLNLSVLYHHGDNTALDFISMSMIILLLSAVHWFTVNLMLYTSNRNTHAEKSQFMKPVNGNLEHSDLNIQCQIKSMWESCRENITKLIGCFKQWSATVPNNQQHSVEKDRYDNDHDTDEHSQDESERSASIPPLFHNRVNTFLSYFIFLFCVTCNDFFLM
ncbi:Uncharacterized protein GBIM_01465 [Gryllus bimaculatus]|nr:Uncharacterized protein GBIM_01465 [Gryllus bimaculatus]